MNGSTNFILSRPLLALACWLVNRHMKLFSRPDISRSKGGVEIEVWADQGHVVGVLVYLVEKKKYNRQPFLLGFRHDYDE